MRIPSLATLVLPATAFLQIDVVCFSPTPCTRKGWRPHSYTIPHGPSTAWRASHVGRLKPMTAVTDERHKFGASFMPDIVVDDRSRSAYPHDDELTQEQSHIAAGEECNGGNGAHLASTFTDTVADTKVEPGECSETSDEECNVSVAEELMNTMVGGVVDGAKSVNPVSRGADGSFEIDGQGLVNLMVLVGSALWVAHTFFTVDATIWRGWTLQETLMRLPWDNWGSYETGLVEHPVLTKTGINVVIYLLGDWLAQINWGRNSDTRPWEFDLKRTLRNGLVGALFGPVAHYYYDFSDSILPLDVGINRVLKIFMDQSVYFCSKCTVYIVLISLLRGDSVETTRETAKTKVPEVVTTGWKFWPFVHVGTYFFIPPRHRVLWVNCVDLLWSSILAGMASKASSGTGEAELGGQTDGEKSG